MVSGKRWLSVSLMHTLFVCVTSHPPQGPPFSFCSSSLISLPLYWDGTHARALCHSLDIGMCWDTWQGLPAAPGWPHVTPLIFELSKSQSGTVASDNRLYRVLGGQNTKNMPQSYLNYPDFPVPDYQMPNYIFTLNLYNFNLWVLKFVSIKIYIIT